MTDYNLRNRWSFITNCTLQNKACKYFFFFFFKSNYLSQDLIINIFLQKIFFLQFAKFTVPTQVPKRFFEKKILLEGRVKNIEAAEQPYILVDHKPLIPLPRLGSPKYLPVKISGVNVTGNGLYIFYDLIFLFGIILVGIFFCIFQVSVGYKQLLRIKK